MTLLRLLAILGVPVFCLTESLWRTPLKNCVQILKLPQKSENPLLRRLLCADVGVSLTASANTNELLVEILETCADGIRDSLGDMLLHETCCERLQSLVEP